MRIVNTTCSDSGTTTARLVRRSVVAMAVLVALGLAVGAWAQGTTPAAGGRSGETSIEAAAPGEPTTPPTLPTGLRWAIDNTWAKLQTYVPNMLIALGVLAGGTLLAWILAALLHWVLDKLALNKRLKSYLPEGAPGAEVKPPDSSRWISTAAFWAIELFVIAAFFQVLKLTSGQKSLDGLLKRVFEYLPRLLGAALILLVAWVVAGVLRLIITRALLASRLDERLRKRIGEAEPPKWSLSETLGKTVYWLVLVIFLPAIFDALSIEGLRNPTSAMLDKVLTFLPNVFLATVILLVGWLVARLVQRILGNLLAAAGTNRLAERVGLGKVLGKKTPSDLIALVVYVLILIPVVIAALNALNVESVTRPASEMLSGFLAAIPVLFVSAFILAVAWVVGRLLCRLTTNLLEGIGFDQLPAKLGLGGVKGQGVGAETTSLSQVCGYIVLVVVMLLVSLQVLALLKFETLADVVRESLAYMGNVSLAVVILGLGLYLAALASRTLQASSITYAATLSMLARIAIIAVAAAMALERVGVGAKIVQTAFTLVLGAVAVAAAVAFGMGGRDLAKRQLEEWSEKLRNRGRR